jgi:DNA-binding transcriptional ArsR family regulator
VTAKAQGVQDLEDLDLVFGALAHRSRRTILAILQARGGQMTSGAIAARFDCAWPTTTRHLRVLEDAGLVRVELQGRERVYRLDAERLAAVAGLWIGRFARGPNPSRRGKNMR